MKPEGSLQLQAFARRHSISRRLNRPISISLSHLSHLALSVMASTTRPSLLTRTPVKIYFSVFSTAMETLHGEIPRMFDQNVAQHRNWLASFQFPLIIRFLACLACALRAATKEVATEYNKSLKLIHADKCFLDGAAEAFTKLQPAYTV